MSDIETRARSAMTKHDLCQIADAMGDDHHTDAPFTQADREIGELAYWLGGLLIDQEVNDMNTPIRDTYWHNTMTSLDQWMRVARALRIHGLKIVNARGEEAITRAGGLPIAAGSTGRRRG